MPSPAEPSGVEGKEICALCGLPLGRFRVAGADEMEGLRFCCPGCRQVFSILSRSPEGMPVNFKETELYQACREAGIIPAPAEPLSTDWETSKFPDLPPLTLTLQVEGMWCPACAWLIEEILRRAKGVLEVRASFLSDLVQVKYFPNLTGPEEIASRVSRLGYGAAPFSGESKGPSARRSRLLRLGVSSILAFNAMMISMVLYAGFFHDLSRGVVAYFSFPLLAIATPAVFYGGAPVFRRAWTALLHGTASMETLIAIGVLAAYFYSLVQMARGSLHLYFDTAAMLITLVLLGKYIETSAREKVTAGILELQRMTNQKVRLGKGQEERWVPADAVTPGDEFTVRKDERIPLDGRILSGRAEVDESVLTGESRPVRKGAGQNVLAGSLLLEGELRLQALCPEQESSLGQMVRLIEEALAKKNPVDLLADRITRFFVPGVLLIAFGTALFVWQRRMGADEAFLRFLAVLVISCPCALGLATPLAKVASMSLGRSRGILVRDPAALERARELDAIVFDKTGTLTEGRYLLRDIVAPGFIRRDVLCLLAAVESHSDHFLAREIVNRARQENVLPGKAEHFKEFPGMGVSGFWDGKEVFIGNRRLMTDERMFLPASLEEQARTNAIQGMTAVFLGWGGEVRGLLVFGDSPKAGAKEMIQTLSARGIDLWMVSGDTEETTRSVARSLGIRQSRGQILPREKAEWVRTLQQEGRRVGMVGDGINDAAALAQADVGFAVGTAGANLLREASDLTFLHPDPGRILDALELSALTVKTIRQNLFFSFFYNILGIPLAMAGVLNPLLAACAMFISSLTVILNALRITRRQNLRLPS